jgi:hypothetical protein
MEEPGILENHTLLSLVLPDFEPGQNPVLGPREGKKLAGFLETVQHRL